MPSARGKESRWSIFQLYPAPDRKARCTIEDDELEGRGNGDQRNCSGHRSGIELVSERLRIYNAMTRRDYKIIIEDLYPEREDTGTRVTVDLPAGIKSLS